MHDDEPNDDAWQGSPAWLPKTGTVHAEFSLVESDADRCPRPKKYCVPSAVVTFQYSPLSSAFCPPVRC